MQRWCQHGKRLHAWLLLCLVPHGQTRQGDWAKTAPKRKKIATSHLGSGNKWVKMAAVMHLATALKLERKQKSRGSLPCLSLQSSGSLPGVATAFAQGRRRSSLWLGKSQNPADTLAPKKSTPFQIQHPWEETTPWIQKQILRAVSKLQLLGLPCFVCNRSQPSKRTLPVKQKWCSGRGFGHLAGLIPLPIS